MPYPIEKSRPTQFKKGQDNRRNIKGRPAGARSYKTIYLEALKKIGKEDGLSPQEMEELLEQTGLKQALKGNFQFWKDIRDRVYGTVTQKSDITTGGEKINTLSSEEKDKLLALLDEKGIGESNTGQ